MKVRKLAHQIEEHYAYHGVRIKLKLLSATNNGERLIFQVCLKPGIRTNLIFDRASDIQMALHMPLFQPYIDGLNICLVVSKNSATQNSLLQMLKSRTFNQSRDWLPIAIGYNMRQEMFFADLAKMPHIMYAGSTNSGKSMGLICLILSLIVKQPVQNVNLIIFDIGANSLGVFGDIPHLSYPIVKEYGEGVYVIKKLVEEMERRIKLSQDELRHLPALVCVIDEYVSFINNISDKKQLKGITDDISNLIRRGRHAKIHFVFSTQDPAQNNMKVDVGNITTRIAFKCAKYQNSIAILGVSGAEKLSSRGMLLMKSIEYPDPMYVQGAFISPAELAKLVDHIKGKVQDFDNKFTIPEYEVLEILEQTGEDEEKMCGKDEEMAQIVMWVLSRDKVSASQIMDQFAMGNRAYGIVEQLYKMGLIAEKFANQQRKVLPQSMEEVPKEVMELLQSHGYTVNMVLDVISNKNNN